MPFRPEKIFKRLWEQQRASLFVDLKDALVFAAPKLEADVIQILVKFAVYQNIYITQEFICHFTVCFPVRIQKVIFIGITGVAPDILFWKALPKPAKQRQQGSLVYGFHRLSS